MGILSRIFGSDEPRREVVRAEPQLAAKSFMSTDTFGTNPSLFGFGGGVFPPSTGTPVTPFTALQAAAVYGCVKCLSEDIAKLPIVLRQRLPGGGYKPVTGHPLNRLFRQPNAWQTPFEFFCYLVSSLALRGNAYAAILRDNAGRPRRLIPLNPDRVSVFMAPAGWLFYLVSHALVGQGITIHQDDMVHLRNPHGMIGDGVMGTPPIMAASEAIGLALATQTHGGTLFRNGAQISGVLHTEGTLTAEAAQRIAQSWREVYSGVHNVGKIAVLEQGLKFDRLSMDNEAAQFLATRQYQAVEICRFFRVPPHKIFDLTRATFSNIENQSQDYIADALQPICTQIEQRFELTLLFEDEREEMDIGFDFDALLRGDTLSRYNSYAIALTHGWMNRNQVRIAENLTPDIPEGDRYLVQLNLGSSGTKPGDTRLAPNTVDPAAQPKPSAESSGAGIDSPDY